MVKKIVLFFLLNSIGTLYSVAQKDYKGRVIDANTKEPIPYVNIGIKEAGVGTVSDEEGLFHMYLKPQNLELDTSILFSALGYETLYFPISDLKLVYNEYPDVALKPSVVELNEVVLFNDGQEFIPDNIGYENYGEIIFGYWKDDIALGGELATRITAKDGLRQLHKLSFKIKQAPADSVLLRINIYDDDGGVNRLPDTNLNKSGKNIFCKVYNYSEVVQIDLNPFELFVEDDFIVSLELVNYYGNSEPEFAIDATYQSFGSYRKYTSQDKWEKFSNFNLAYQLETSLLVSRRLAEKFKGILVKKTQKQSYISGFIVINGKMIPNVEVKNLRTSKTVVSDTLGRYRLHAKKGDVLVFSKKGVENVVHKTSNKTTVNVRMKRILN
ncbi:carboxypeptidase-like regulatory domain-containing protein [Croceitalea rosinachiae]|uniref:Carboxypeptidase-like regulatory domain-containing protein n=1 Tax=Croceitalea rosinachiae TaxID=3075596 RepID=A0ABU3AB16_9FLAO|nr:carboxypeptidase-like regulatory domain-containing protein [Croceitalea sp. F388]MDT0607376.1 carboxypeptidase-like regulatory domain-containing protein [Croceitalea sp. F388]